MRVSGVWIDEVWPDREPVTKMVEFEPRLMGRLSSSLAAVIRGNATVHAAPLLRQRTKLYGDFVYPRLVSICGVKGWGDTEGPVTCGRCLNILKGK